MTLLERILAWIILVSGAVAILTVPIIAVIELFRGAFL